MVEAVSNAQLVIVTVPSASFRAVARLLRQCVKDGTYVVSGTKGVEKRRHEFRLMSQILHEEVPRCVLGVLSGPNLAEEIAQGQIAGTVIASESSHLVAYVQQTLQHSRFRVFGSSDVYGVELGGALKNIYAIICGIASGLEVGQNAVAMILTRSLTEMCRFANAMGANPFTFLGLSGVGDLLATCTSSHSRNFRLGYEISQGNSLDTAVEKLGKLAEGVNTLEVIYEKKKELQLNMPLVEALYGVLMRGEDLRRKIVELMTSVEDIVDVEFSVSRSN